MDVRKYCLDQRTRYRSWKESPERRTWYYYFVGDGLRLMTVRLRIINKYSIDDADRRRKVEEILSVCDKHTEDFTRRTSAGVLGEESWHDVAYGCLFYCTACFLGLLFDAWGSSSLTNVVVTTVLAGVTSASLLFLSGAVRRLFYVAWSNIKFTVTVLRLMDSYIEDLQGGNS